MLFRCGQWQEISFSLQKVLNANCVQNGSSRVLRQEIFDQKLKIVSVQFIPNPIRQSCPLATMVVTPPGSYCRLRNPASI